MNFEMLRPIFNDHFLKFLFINLLKFVFEISALKKDLGIFKILRAQIRNKQCFYICAPDFEIFRVIYFHKNINTRKHSKYLVPNLTSTPFL